MKTYSQIVKDYDLAELVGPDGELNSSGTEYIVQCPICLKEKGPDYKKKKLYIASDYSKGFCQRCCSVFFPPDDKGTKDKNKSWSKTATNIPVIRATDCSYYWNSREEQQSGIDYLIGRDSWFKDHYKELGIRFRDDRVVIPFYNNGQSIYYYQSRFIDPNSGIRYHNPHCLSKPIYVCPISNLNSTKIILCEGVFGAIAIARRFPDYKVMAVLGSRVHSYQCFLLLQTTITEIALYFDNRDINFDVRKELRQNFPDVPIKIAVVSPDTLGDPEDDLKAGREVTFKEAKDVSFTGLFLSNINSKRPRNDT